MLPVPARHEARPVLVHASITLTTSFPPDPVPQYASGWYCHETRLMSCGWKMYKRDLISDLGSDLGSVNYYKKWGKEFGLEFVDYMDYTEDMATHYELVRLNLCILSIISCCPRSPYPADNLLLCTKVSVRMCVLRTN